MTLTDKDFECRYDKHRTFPFFEDENGVYGYGHTDKAEFAEAVNEYDRYCGYDGEFGHDSADVTHGYARAANDPDDPELAALFCARGDKDASPVTWISR